MELREPGSLPLPELVLLHRSKAVAGTDLHPGSLTSSSPLCWGSGRAKQPSLPLHWIPTSARKYVEATEAEAHYTVTHL